MVTTAQHTATATAQQTRRGPARPAGPDAAASRRSGQPPIGGGLLPPEVATAIGARGRFRTATTTQTDPTRTDPPLRGATPELESVDRDAILDENGSVS
jgi:hypothetical protein